MRLHSGHPWEIISLFLCFCVQPTCGAQEYQTCTDTTLSGYHFTPWLSGASEIHFLCQEKFILGQCRIRTRELLVFSRLRYHWTKMPRLNKVLLLMQESILDYLVLASFDSFSSLCLIDYYLSKN